jgi:signal peptidase II
MTDRGKFLSFYSVLFTVLLIGDAYSKIAIVQYLTETESLELTPFLKFGLVYNRGAAFGFLSEQGGWQQFLFISIALGVSLLILIRLFRAAGSCLWYEISLVLILAGALGNLLDRIRIGEVIDFVQVYYDDWQFPAFNLADMAIFVGVVMLILEILGLAPGRRTSR